MIDGDGDVFLVDELGRTLLRQTSERPTTLAELARILNSLSSFQVELRERWNIDLHPDFNSAWWELEIINALAQESNLPIPESELDDIDRAIDVMEMEVARVMQRHGVAAVAQPILGTLSRYGDRLGPTEVVEALVEAQEWRLAAEELIHELVMAGIALKPEELEALSVVKLVGVAEELLSSLTTVKRH